MTGGRFPPVVQYPESKRGDILLSTLFTWPIIVWAPECMNPLKSPSALSPDARVHLG
ncbi:hypothetical protein JG687_00017643 [Phytophthora cactorum]|uniref:Uncharacterized protein n=1 Tax=Phytophthora cactorum TaxID=29920 RepID=A0A8T1TSR3_9STRA|nr:hypothetical protein JG687_00017643 [Phytophthora cactorum]